MQAEIVRLLAATHRNVMAVGDDAQSIYSFRGANFRNILDFPKLFPECAHHQARRELPLDPGHSRCRQRGDFARRRELHQGAFHEASRRDCARCWCARRRAHAVAIRRPAHPGVARGGRGAERDRGALPVELPFLRSGTGAAAARHPVHQAWRLQVHRDRARQGCPRASARGGESYRCGFMAARADPREGRRQSHRRAAHRGADQRARAREGADRVECGDDCARPRSRRLPTSGRVAGVDARRGEASGGAGRCDDCLLHAR